MAANIQDLKDNSNTVYPTTKTTAVWSESGENLEEILSEKVAVVLSVTQPASQNNGDIWYEVIT